MTKLLENLLSKFTAGCYSVGDVVKFVGDIKKSPVYKELPPDMKEKLDAMVEADGKGDAVIVVAGVTSGVWDKPDNPSTISLAYSQGGGRWFDPISLPAVLGEFFKVQPQGYANIPNDIPQNAHHYNQENNRREEADMDDLEKHRNDPNVPSAFEL